MEFTSPPQSPLNESMPKSLHAIRRPSSPPFFRSSRGDQRTGERDQNSGRYFEISGEEGDMRGELRARGEAKKELFCTVD